MLVTSVWKSSVPADYFGEFFKDDFYGLKIVRESYRSHLFFCETEIEPIKLKTFFTNMRRLGIYCQTIKLFFDGPLPDLGFTDFVKEATWYYYPHPEPDVAIFALPYGDDQWCYQLDRRTGFGVMMDMFDILPFYPQTKQLTMEGLL